MSLRHGHGFTIKALGLVDVRQTHADHGDFCLFCGFSGFAQTFLGHSALDIAAGGKRHAGHSVAEGCQAGRVDVAGPCALVAHGACHLADQGDVARVQRQDATLVFQKHSAVFCDFLRQCVVGVLVKGVSLGAVFSLEGKGDHPCGAGVYVTFGQGAVPDGGGDPVLHISAAARHTQVAPGVHGLDAVTQRAPVGHDQTGKTPIRAQDIGQQPMVVAGVDIVDARVAAHNGFGLGSLDYGLKRGQVQLAQGALIHLAVAVEPLVLLIVGGKMLEAGACAGALRALHPCRAHRARNAGILGEILKVAPAQRVALDVDAGSQHHIHTVGKSFLTDGLSLGFQQFGVPCCAARHGGGEAGGRLGLVDAQHIGAVFLAAHAVGAIAHRNGGDAVLRHRLAVPEIRTVAKADFILQRHFRQNVRYFFIHRAYSLSA